MTWHFRDKTFSTPEMTAVFSDQANLRALLRVEAALARAQARAGLIPMADAQAIGQACEGDHYDIEALATAAGRAGTPVIPLVAALIGTVRQSRPEAARNVHRGATSQDVIDTALVLQMRDGLALIHGDLAAVCTAACRLTRAHRNTLMLGRTLLQPGPPITFGLKAAGWLAALDRSRRRLLESADAAIAVQFGGAVGTLAALGVHGLLIAENLAAELSLPLPALPWHAHSDSQVGLLCDIAILIGTLAKIACDISLMMQFELAEVAEPGGGGRGGSSAMPHKRNPTASMLALAAHYRAPGLAAAMIGSLAQEGERGLGNWQSQWATIPDLFAGAAAALSSMREALTGLAVYPDRCRHNLDRLNGIGQAEAVLQALSADIDRQRAHHLVETAVAASVAENRPLRDVLADFAEITSVLSAGRLDELLDPVRYLGMTQTFIDRALNAHESAGIDDHQDARRDGA
jgi:3-carboxy-cis,cis-muconate cycloisomerase